MWDDPEWQACFVSGFVNAVVSGQNPLPKELPDAIQEALDHGVFLQLTEPWKPGCDNSLKHPDCSIGFVKLFGEYATLRAFVQKGEFTQAGVAKKGPWSDYSLWATDDFVQLAEGETLSTEDKELLCSGALGLVFALDGEYFLPQENPCDGSNNRYFVRERWNGGCVGDVLQDQNCNVGEILVFDQYDDAVEAISGDGWNRGSLFVNNRRLIAMVGIVVATATPMAPSTTPPTVAPTSTPTAAGTETPTPTATTPGTLQDNGSQKKAVVNLPFLGQVSSWIVGIGALACGGLFIALIGLLVWLRNRSDDEKPISGSKLPPVRPDEV